MVHERFLKRRARACKYSADAIFQKRVIFGPKENVSGFSVDEGRVVLLEPCTDDGAACGGVHKDAKQVDKQRANVFCVAFEEALARLEAVCVRWGGDKGKDVTLSALRNMQL